MPFSYALPVPPELEGRGPIRLERTLAPLGGAIEAGTPVAIVSADGGRFEILANGPAYLLEYNFEVGSELQAGAALALVGADGESIPYGKPYSLLRALGGDTATTS